MKKNCIYFLLLSVKFRYIICENYQCQNTTLNLNCPSGQLIHITEVYYGRNNNTICPIGNTQQNCSVQTATIIVGNKCNNKQNCTILINSTDLDDPCPGVSKYIQVNHSCILPNFIQCGNFEHVASKDCRCKDLCPNHIPCTFDCVVKPTCVCDEGFLRDPNTKLCILAEFCPQKGSLEHNHEEFCECATRQRKCNNPWVYEYSKLICRPGYGCKEGYYREPYGNKCVRSYECPRPYPRWR